MLAGVTRVFGAFRRQHRIAARPDSFFQLSQIRLFLAVHVCPRAGHVRLSPVSVHAVDGIFHTARAICTHHAVYFQNSMIGIMAPVPVRHAHLFFCRLPFAAAAAALPQFLCIGADTEATKTTAVIITNLLFQSKGRRSARAAAFTGTPEEPESKHGIIKH